MEICENQLLNIVLPLSFLPPAEASEDTGKGSSSREDAVELLPSSRTSRKNHFTHNDSDSSGDSIDVYESKNL